MDERKLTRCRTRRGMVVVGGVAYYAEPLIFLSGKIVIVNPSDGCSDSVRVSDLDGTEICIAEKVEGGSDAS